MTAVSEPSQQSLIVRATRLQHMAVVCTALAACSLAEALATIDLNSGIPFGTGLGATLALTTLAGVAEVLSERDRNRLRWRQLQGEHEA